MGVIATNRVIWTPDVPIIYMDNPKAGSTTIKFTLKQAQAAEYARRGKAFRRNAEPHKADDCLKSRGLRLSRCRDRLLISCVRNPFTRILSGYLDKVRPRDPRYFPELRSRKVENFEDFMQAVADFKPSRLNFHFRPQHMNLDFPRLQYSAVFFLENVAALSRFLGELSPDLALEKNAPHSRSARSKLQEHYTGRAIDLVREVYAADFSLFGYGTGLDEVDETPGECIIDASIVPAGQAGDRLNVARMPDVACAAFQSTLRFHRLVETLKLN
jgi:sulfotransferase famil protein